MREARSVPHIIVGWGVVLVVALAAWWMQYLPFPPFRVENGAGVYYPINAAILAIVLGLIIRNTIGLPASLAAGRKQVLAVALPIAIVCIGAGLDLTVLATIGITLLLIILAGIVIGFVAAYALGRLFQLSGRTSALLGFGTAICGSSAIVAAAPVMRANDDEMVLAIATVNLIGLAAMLLLPLWGGVLAMPPEAFGVWAGASIHAVPQAITAGFAFGGGAGEFATLAKLVRVAMLAPLIFLTAIIVARAAAQRNADQENSLARIRFRDAPVQTSFGYARLVPWFIYGFAAMALVNTAIHGAAENSEPDVAIAGLHTLAANVGPFAIDFMSIINQIGGLLLIVCMAAIGLDVQLRTLIATGRRAIIAAALAAIILALGTLTLIQWLL